MGNGMFMKKLHAYLMELIEETVLDVVHMKQKRYLIQAMIILQLQDILQHALNQG